MRTRGRFPRHKTEKTAYTASIGGSYTNQYQYDYAGRVTRATNAQSRSIGMEYDMLGNLTGQTDYLGNKALYSYDALGRNTMIQTPFERVGGTTYYATQKYDYDQTSNVTRLHSSNNAAGQAAAYSVTEYGYDVMGNLSWVRNVKPSLTFLAMQLQKEDKMVTIIKQYKE